MVMYTGGGDVYAGGAVDDGRENSTCDDICRGEVMVKRMSKAVAALLPTLLVAVRGVVEMLSIAASSEYALTSRAYGTMVVIGHVNVAVNRSEE